jgi:hypothetical protein
MAALVSDAVVKMADPLRREGEFGTQAGLLLAAYSEIEFDRTP